MKTLHTIYTSFAKRLALLFVLLIAIGIGNGYAAQETLNGSFVSSNTTSGGFTASGGTAGKYYKLQTGYIISDNSYSVDATKSISISMKVGTFGNYSANKQSVDFYAIDKNGNIISNKVTASFSKANSDGTTFSGTIKLNSGISGNEVRFKFASNSDATSTVCARFYNFTITYESAPSTFTVTYNANGATSGTVPTDGNEYESGTAVTVLGNTGNLVKTGYRFDGWQIDKAGTVYNAGDKFNISANTTLYAKWTERQLTNYRTSCTTETIVTLDPNGGTISYTDGWTDNGNGTYSKIHEGIEIALPTATKTNYIFGGWYNGETKYESIPSDLDESITLTAKWLEKQAAGIYWDPESVTVTIDADGNILPEFNNPNEIDGIEFSSSNPSVVAVDANGVITLGSTGTTATVTITATFNGDETYAAKTVTCSITVHPSNCKWVETDIANINSGDEVVIAMEKDGYTYALKDDDGGATSAPPATEIKINPNNTIKTSETPISTPLIWNIDYDKEDTKNLVIYSTKNVGKWLYSISDNNGVRIGSNTNKEFKIVEGTGDDAGNFFLYHVAQNRYLGVYYTTPDWRGYITTNNITGQTLKLYKKVCLDSENYWVTWDAGDGAWTDGSSQKLESYEVDADITAPAENPTHEGYRFDGWTPTPGTMPAENTTFTAQWTEVYKITWYENGVPSYTYVPSDNAVVTWEDNIADCGKKKFYGWTADETFVSDPTTPPSLISKGTTIAGDVTYFAVYADAEEPANPGYTKVTTISEGTYLIAAPSKNIAYKAVTSDVPAVISNNVISSLPEGATELLVELGTNTNAGYFAISYNNNGTKTYIYGADKSLSTTNTATYDWSLDADNATLGEIQSKSKSGYYIQANNTNGDFKAYAHTQTIAYLYKKQTTTYANFAISCATYTITVTTPTGGTVTTTADEAGAGQEITINIIPDDCKYLTALKYNDGNDHSINIASAPYTFTMPAADVTITATFADKTATAIEILTSAHRMLMQGSAFVGEQVRITYNNGDKETLNWNDSRLTFTGHNTATLGSQTVTVTYNDCGTQSASYNIEVIDGLGITFWDDDYTETIKYEPGDLVDVDNRIGQNICSGWEFAGWSETKVANESEEYVPVHNFNATDAKVLYAVYVKKKAQWTTIVTADEAKSGAKYVLAYDRYDTYYALTSSVKDVNYLAGKVVTSTEGELNSFDVYYLSAEPTADLIWELVSTGENGKWYLYNKNTAKYIDLSTQGQIHLTDLPSDKLQMESGYNDSQIRIASSTVPTYYLSWDNSNTRYNTYASSNSQEYWYTKDEEFTSTPPCSPLSATFHGNGGIVTDGIKSGDYLTIKEPTRDAGITTPTASFADCNGKSWTFVGWSREEIDVTRIPVLTTDLLHDGGGNKHYDIEEDGEEFWAVFTNIGNPETKYGTITFTDADVTRQYENAKTITKSVTAMGDYEFELYHVSNASNKGIQFDNDVATKGYIKNITSLGKINSISLNDFQTGDIDDVKVYVGNMPNAINTLLTEADLQQTGNTYTYYPQKNYAYVKIEANGYCGITSISIDFGKGTQIWATTPDCSTITLSGDELYVTSTNDQSIRAAERLTVKAVQLESKAKVVISSNSSDIYFSDVLDANFTQAVKPTETLTLTTDVDGNLSATEIYVHYRPSVDGTGIPEDVVVSANLETPNPGITDDHTIHVRNLPATFAIVAKVGNVWYALPSQGLNSETTPVGYPVEVDNNDNPTAVTAVPANADWSLRQVYASSGSNDRFADNGEKLVFVNDANPQKALNAGSIGNYLLTDAQYDGYHNTTNPGLYEWIPTTTDLETYQLTNEQRSRILSVNTATIFGVHATDKAVEQVRFLPIQNRYIPAALQVVEWKENSVVIMYNGDPAQTASVSVSGAAAQNTTLSTAQRDIAVYELAATGLAANPTQRLSITIGTETTILSIPYIISGSKNDIDVLPGSTVAARQEVAKVSDLVILKDATLAANGAKGNPYKFRNVTIYGGGSLIIPAEKGFGASTITMRVGGVENGQYENLYPQLQLNGTLTNTSGQINLDYLTTNDFYNPLSVPYSVTIKDIQYPVDIYGTNVTSNNTGSFQFKYYNGAERAAGRTGWIVLDETTNTTLNPNTGYAIWGIPKKVKVNGGESTRQKFGIHRLPLKQTAANMMTSEQQPHSATINVYNGSKRDSDNGWNYLGNPYLSHYGDFTTADNVMKLGKLVWDEEQGAWVVTDEEQRYVVFTNDCQNYIAELASSSAIPAFSAFFIQADQGGAINFTSPNVATPQSLAARHSKEETKEITTGIILSGEKHSDRIGLLIADQFTQAYEFNADLSKFDNQDMNLYTISSSGKLAFMAINEDLAKQTIPLGYSVSTDGMYSIAFDEQRYSRNDIYALYLIDYDRNETTNLLHMDYNFYSETGAHAERFALQVAFAPKTPTDVEYTQVGDVLLSREGNTLRLDNLPSDATVTVYDAVGHLVEQHTASQLLQLTLQKGYYLLHIGNNQNSVVIDTFIP